MKTTFRNIFIVLAMMLVIVSCSKQDDDLSLDSDYLPVSDVLEYCQGDCGDLLEWEGSEIRVKGHIPDVEDEEAMNAAYAAGRFYLHDIRNGMFIEIRTGSDKDAIFLFMNSLSKQDEVYIRGVAESVIVNEGNKCIKGVVLVLNSSQDIDINL